MNLVFELYYHCFPDISENHLNYLIIYLSFMPALSLYLSVRLFVHMSYKPVSHPDVVLIIGLIMLYVCLVYDGRIVI